MTNYGYPHTGYGVELRTEKGWVLLDGIQKNRNEAEHVAETIIGRHGPDPDEIRVVTLTITRKETKND